MLQKITSYISKFGELPGCIMRGGFMVSTCALLAAIIIALFSMPVSLGNYENLIVAKNLISMSFVICGETIAAAAFIDRYQKAYEK